MRNSILAFSIAAALCAVPAPIWSGADTTSDIIALERKVMDGWIQGDPDPLLAVADAEITYFHMMTEKRVDGLAALKALVEPYRGRSLFDSYEMLYPEGAGGGDTAVLTYILLRRQRIRHQPRERHAGLPEEGRGVAHHSLTLVADRAAAHPRDLTLGRGVVVDHQQARAAGRSP